MKNMTSLPKYQEYKDSGYMWLGHIPKHWKSLRLKDVARRFSNGTTAEQLSSDESEISVSRIESISNGVINYSKIGFLKTGRGLDKYILNQNDFLISHINSYEKVGNSAIYDGSQPLWHGMNLVRITPKQNIVVGYLKHVFKSEIFIGAMKRACKPAINQVSVPTSAIKSIRVPFPKREEQLEIANFLDNKTTLLDSAIAIKEQQIKLLKERKKIIIQKAVTQGLKPNAVMKDSGVDWVGDIPEHWQVKRAKYLFDEIDERSINGDEELLSVSHLTGVTPRSEKSVTMIAEDYSGSKTCNKNDLVMNIMWAWMGAMGVSDRPGIVSSAYSIFRQTPLDLFNPVFLEWLVTTVGYIEHYNKVSTGLHSSRLRFYSRMFFDMEIGYPSRKEQDEIVSHIEKQSFKIDDAVELQKQQIQKLKEYKTTLINSAVTGKIKVS